MNESVKITNLANQKKVVEKIFLKRNWPFTDKDHCLIHKYIQYVHTNNIILIHTLGAI